jgi:hypothetical protein
VSGILWKAVPKRVFDFSNSFTSLTFTVIERIDISQYIDCMLAVRVHTATVAGGASLNFDLIGDGYTSDDPGLQFRTSSPLITSQAISASTTSSLLSYGGTVHGHYAALVATVTKSSASALSVTASIDLILRSPDEVDAGQ